MPFQSYSLDADVKDFLDARRKIKFMNEDASEIAFVMSDDPPPKDKDKDCITNT